MDVTPGKDLRIGNQENPMKQLLKQKYNHLRDSITRAEMVAIAFSGGVDSTFLLKVCSDLLGDRVLAVTARSETFPKRELEEAKELARQNGVKHIIVDSKELEIPGFTDNSPNRCFFCKTELFTKTKEIANKHGIRWVFDGSNADDLEDFRPGLIAGQRLGIRSPLLEARLTKKEIRSLSQKLKLTTWDKPSLACLASRFPYHTKITKTALRQVEEAENYLWRLGMRLFRVRYHGSVARIELGKKEMELLQKRDLAKKISRHLRTLGFKYPALDLEGYRSGSMNETLASGSNKGEKQWTPLKKQSDYIIEQ